MNIAAGSPDEADAAFVREIALHPDYFAKREAIQLRDRPPAAVNSGELASRVAREAKEMAEEPYGGVARAWVVGGPLPKAPVELASRSAVPEQSDEAVRRAANGEADGLHAP